MSQDIERKCDEWRRQNSELIAKARVEGPAKISARRQYDMLAFMWVCEDWFVANFPTPYTAEERIAQQVPLAVLRQEWRGMYEDWSAPWHLARLEAQRESEREHEQEHEQLRAERAALERANTDERARRDRRRSEMLGRNAELLRTWAPRIITFELTPGFQRFAHLVSAGCWADMFARHTLTEKKWEAYRLYTPTPRRVTKKKASVPRAITVRLDERFREFVVEVDHYMRDKKVAEALAWREVFLAHLCLPEELRERLAVMGGFDDCDYYDDSWCPEARAWEWTGWSDSAGGSTYGYGGQSWRAP